MSDSLVIIPTYNEKENVVKMIEAVVGLDQEFDVLIVDDGSPDGTADLVKAQIKKYASRIFLLEREEKQGLGTAYIAGFKWALERDFNYVFEMDCDFSHTPKDLIRLKNSCAENGAGVAVGSRYVQGGGVVNWPLKRRVMSRGASLYVNLILWLGVRDSTAGFVGYRREVLEALDLNSVCIPNRNEVAREEKGF